MLAALESEMEVLLEAFVPSSNPLLGLRVENNFDRRDVVAKLLLLSPDLEVAGCLSFSLASAPKPLPMLDYSSCSSTVGVISGALGQ